MKIPHYLQTDYANVPYGSSNIAACGCGPTSFAMVASYLTGTTITPADAVAWCGNSYYVWGGELAGLISKQLRNTLAVGLSGSRMMLMRY